ncbi:hypothetical protein Syun_025276 [Stephania yunnanensis]|uniref:Uncharacterized protein n=1 Tax=Stephania yunnanensis TaxID=152371 RepID=A0AAP0ERX0_9MAGN
MPDRPIHCDKSHKTLFGGEAKTLEKPKMSASRVAISRLSIRSSSLRRNATTSSSPISSLNKSSSSDSAKRFSTISRLPMVLRSLGSSMMPLHSAIASARLRSILAMESQSWGLIPQGISMPL